MVTIATDSYDRLERDLRWWNEAAGQDAMSPDQAMCHLFDWDLFHEINPSVLEQCGIVNANDAVAIDYIRNTAFGAVTGHLQVDEDSLPEGIGYWYRVCQWDSAHHSGVPRPVRGSESESAENAATTLRRFLAGESPLDETQLDSVIKASSPGMFRLIVTSFADRFVLNVGPTHASILAKYLLRLSARLSHTSEIWSRVASQKTLHDSSADQGILGHSRVATALIVLESVMHTIEVPLSSTTSSFLHCPFENISRVSKR